MKNLLSLLIKNNYKTIFKSYVLSKKTYGDIDYLCFKINKNCYLGKKNEKILIPVDTVILPAILKKGSWEAHIIDLIKINSKKNYVFLDIGANIGLISKQLLNANVKLKKVFCFEPDKEKIDLIKYNLSKYKNIKVLNYGLGKFNKKLKLYKNIANFGDTSFIKKTSNFCTASIKNINNFFLKNKILNNFPIIYKSDTQGMDEEIIFSLKEKFLKKIEILVIEITNHNLILKNKKKFEYILNNFKKFYLNKKYIYKKNIFNKIKNKDEFDLTMVK